MSGFLDIGIVIAIIAAFANLLVSLLNSRQLKLLEKRKQQHDFVMYRYTKLYDILEKIQAYPKITAPLDGSITEDFVLNNNGLTSFLGSVFLLAKPLLSENIRKSIETEYLRFINGKIDLIGIVGISETNEKTKELSEKFAETLITGLSFEKTLVEGIQKQLSLLLDLENKK